jgi:hypothetical protein
MSFLRQRHTSSWPNLLRNQWQYWLNSFSKEYVEQFVMEFHVTGHQLGDFVMIAMLCLLLNGVASSMRGAFENHRIENLSRIFYGFSPLFPFAAAMAGRNLRLCAKLATEALQLFVANDSFVFANHAGLHGQRGTAFGFTQMRQS